MEEHKSVASGKAETAPLFWESLDTEYKDRICKHGAKLQNSELKYKEF